MINEPSMDALIRKLGTPEAPASRYALCVVVAKRTRQIIEQMQSTRVTELPGQQKEIVLACPEILNVKAKSVQE